MITPTASEAERARHVEEVVHSVRMEGVDVTPADAAEYVAGRITLDEYGRRARARHAVCPRSRNRLVVLTEDVLTEDIDRPRACV